VGNPVRVTVRLALPLFLDSVLQGVNLFHGLFSRLKTNETGSREGEEQQTSEPTKTPTSEGVSQLKPGDIEDWGHGLVPHMSQIETLKFLSL